MLTGVGEWRTDVESSNASHSHAKLVKKKYSWCSNDSPSPLAHKRKKICILVKLYMGLPITFVAGVLYGVLCRSGDIETNPGPKFDLTSNSLGKVQNLLWNARTKWFNIGLGLGIDQETLKMLERNYPNEDDCFREMLSEWLKTIDPTWEELIAALVQPSVGCGHVAAKVKKEQGIPEQKPNGDAPAAVLQQQGRPSYGVSYQSSNSGVGPYGSQNAPPWGDVIGLSRPPFTGQECDHYGHQNVTQHGQEGSQHSMPPDDYSSSVLSSPHLPRASSEGVHLRSLPMNPTLEERKTMGVTSSLFFEAMDGFLINLDKDATILYASESITSYIGLTQHDVIGQDLIDITHPDDKEIIEDNLTPKATLPPGITNRRQNTQPRQFYIRFKLAMSPDKAQLNSYTMVQVTGNLKVQIHRSDSKMCQEVNGFVGECRLIESTASILEMSIPRSSFTITINMDMKIASVESHVKELIGFSTDDFIGTWLRDYFHPADYTKLIPLEVMLMHTGHAVSPLFRFISSNGSWVWMQMEGILRYKPGTNERQFWEIKMKMVSEEEGYISLMEQNGLYTLNSDPYQEILNPHKDHTFLSKLSDSTHLCKHEERADPIIRSLSNANLSQSLMDNVLHAREMGMKHLPANIKTVLHHNQADAFKAKLRKSLADGTWGKPETDPKPWKLQEPSLGIWENPPTNSELARVSPRPPYFSHSLTPTHSMESSLTSNQSPHGTASAPYAAINSYQLHNPAQLIPDMYSQNVPCPNSSCISSQQQATSQSPTHSLLQNSYDFNYAISSSSLGKSASSQSPSSKYYGIHGPNKKKALQDPVSGRSYSSFSPQAPRAATEHTIRNETTNAIPSLFLEQRISFQNLSSFELRLKCNFSEPRIVDDVSHTLKTNARERVSGRFAIEKDCCNDNDNVGKADLDVELVVTPKPDSNEVSSQVSSKRWLSVNTGNLVNYQFKASQSLPQQGYSPVTNHHFGDSHSVVSDDYHNRHQPPSISHLPPANFIPQNPQNIGRVPTVPSSSSDTATSSGGHGEMTIMRDKDIGFLMGYLCQHSYKWEVIGTALHFLPGELENIRHSPQVTTLQLCLREVLCQWVQWPTTAHSQTPTMEMLRDALRSDLVGLGAVANQVYDARNYLPSQLDF